MIVTVSLKTFYFACAQDCTRLEITAIYNQTNQNREFIQIMHPQTNNRHFFSEFFFFCFCRSFQDKKKKEKKKCAAYESPI